MAKAKGSFPGKKEEEQKHAVEPVEEVATESVDDLSQIIEGLKKELADKDVEIKSLTDENKMLNLKVQGLKDTIENLENKAKEGDDAGSSSYKNRYDKPKTKESECCDAVSKLIQMQGLDAPKKAFAICGYASANKIQDIPKNQWDNLKKIIESLMKEDANN